MRSEHPRLAEQGMYSEKARKNMKAIAVEAGVASDLKLSTR